MERSRALLREIEGPFNPGDAVVPLHQWSGTSALLGYSAIGRLARKAEDLMRERPIDQGQLREAVSDLATAFSSPTAARDFPIPVYVLEALSGKRVALVDLPAGELDRITPALERANAIVENYECAGGSIPKSLLRSTLVVAHVRPNSPVTAWLSGDSLLWNACPVVLTGSREDLLALSQAAQSRTREFLMDSWQPEEALVRLSLALTRQPAAVLPSSSPVSGRPRVLVADDDPTVVALVRASLQNFGMDCEAASDGPAALASIRATRPHAAVLDVNMPGMDGYAVLSAVRSDELPVRVLLLTARQQEADILRGFTLGADDYVIKPFSPMELVARLKRLLGR